MEQLHSISMKSNLLLLCAVLCVVFGAPSARGQAANGDLQVIYEEGRAAFNAGQFDLAREKLNIVKARNPSHVPTLAMLTQINQKLGEDNSSLRKSYEGVMIEKVEFTDVELSEAIDAVRILSRKASKEKIVPNITLKTPEIGAKKINLSLTNVPLSEVLNFLAQLSGAKLTYDKYGVTLSNPAG
jgi:hypothetical protein